MIAEWSSFSDDIEPTVGISSNLIGSIADKFSHIKPLVPLSIRQLSGTTQKPLIDDVDLSVEAVISQHTPSEMICTNANNKRNISTPNFSTSPTVSSEVTHTNAGNISAPTSQFISSEMTPPSNSTTSANRSLLDLLVDHTQIIHNSVSEKVLPKARLLTSTECFATLQEKETKRKKALEEKNRKRLEGMKQRPEMEQNREVQSEEKVNPQIQIMPTQLVL